MAHMTIEVGRQLKCKGTTQQVGNLGSFSSWRLNYREMGMPKLS